jgi:hypothetical protein
MKKKSPKIPNKFPTISNEAWENTLRLKMPPRTTRRRKGETWRDAFFRHRDEWRKHLAETENLQVKFARLAEAARKHGTTPEKLGKAIKAGKMPDFKFRYNL